MYKLLPIMAKTAGSFGNIITQPIRVMTSSISENWPQERKQKKTESKRKHLNWPKTKPSFLKPKTRQSAPKMF